MTWTDSDIVKLKQLAEEHHSFAKIATELNKTRNSIIGKAHRLGLHTNPPPTKKASHASTTPRRGIHRPNIGKPFIMKDENATFDDDMIVDIYHLTNATCRWPIEGLYFCGRLEADISSSIPYCPKHTQMARGGGGRR